VWRKAPRGNEIVVVGRDRYADWTLPKGKLEPGEPALAAAIREVREETGVDGIPQVRLPAIQYLTGVPGVEKAVDFWSMRVRADHGRAADDEIAEVRWVRTPEASNLLTYAHDRGVLAAFTALPPVHAEVILVRHALALPKKRWTGDDRVRPLTDAGREQASNLARLLGLLAPAAVVSASPARCRDTVAPLGLPITVDTRLDEMSPEGLDGARDALLALARQPGPTVCCSQGKVIPRLLEGLKPAGVPAAEDFATAKGDGWLLAFSGTRLIAADRLFLDRTQHPSPPPSV
jgi:8-oxo-dGTP diphosphatase